MSDTPAQAIRRSKLAAMKNYVSEAEKALEEDDIFGWREEMEHLMGVVGSEVAEYGGVVPASSKSAQRPTGSAKSYEGPGGLVNGGESQRREEARADDPKFQRTPYDLCANCEDSAALHTGGSCMGCAAKEEGPICAKFVPKGVEK